MIFSASPSKRKIFVCGFMASGKSTLSKNLSNMLNIDLADVDALIQDEEGRSINDIFRQEGETYFREKEKEKLIWLIHNFDGVIALGGGALQDQDLVTEIKKSGILIFIDVPMEEILERVYKRTHRPVLFDGSGKIKPKPILFDELKTLYFQREKYYRQAHFSLNSTDFSSSKEMAAAAINKINLV